MVRLVFRPYTQIRRTICTSVSLRASTRVSPGFTLFRHRSPSFGSQQICSYSNLSQANDRSIVPPRRRVPTSAPRRLHFHCAPGFDTQILAHMLDSLVRVSRRVDENHFVSIATADGHAPVQRRQPQSFALQAANHRPGPSQGANRSSVHPRSRGLTAPKQLPSRRFLAGELMLTHHAQDRPPRPHTKLTTARLRSEVNIRGTTGFQRFPLSNFKYFLTLFSKFFSSFPHGTCSLSVSRQYLALDGIYHPFRAAIPSNSTLRTHVVRGELQDKTGFSPSMIPCSKGLVPGSTHDSTSLDYNSAGRVATDFQVELFPLHSPLLGESLLVSFPPLINMLKFSGSSRFS